MYKKIIIAFFLLIPFLMTGCTNSSKNDYNSVNEYEKAMAEVQSNNTGYKIEGIKHLPKGDYKFTSYVKGNYWKDIMTIRDKNVEMVSNNNGTFILAPNGYQQVNMPYSISAWLFYWNNPEDSQNIKQKLFVNNNSVRNNIQCRELKYIGYNGNSIDMCVSDKYGIAVYYKINGSSYKDLVGQYVEVNKVDIVDIPDSTFDIR